MTPGEKEVTSKRYQRLKEMAKAADLPVDKAFTLMLLIAKWEREHPLSPEERKEQLKLLEMTARTSREVNLPEDKVLTALCIRLNIPDQEGSASLSPEERAKIDAKIDEIFPPDYFSHNEKNS
jgi:hypothetical protein